MHQNINYFLTCPSKNFHISSLTVTSMLGWFSTNVTVEPVTTSGESPPHHVGCVPEGLISVVPPIVEQLGESLSMMQPIPPWYKVRIRGIPVTGKSDVCPPFAMFTRLILSQGGTCNSNVNNTCTCVTLRQN